MDYKKRPWWQWLIIYLIIGGIIYAIVYFVFIKGAYSKKASSTSNPYSSSSQTSPANPTSDTTQANQNSMNPPASPEPTSPTPKSTTTPPAQATKSFTVSADDTGADVESISVAKGTLVSLTFNVKTGTTYHGGLEFVGGGIDTGTITPGSSKTVQFTANSSFSFIPYWPANSVKKDYTIDIKVS